jgi:hypothetical protein
LSADFNGYVNISSLARRTARAIVHFMQVNATLRTWSFNDGLIYRPQTNGITLPWNRVVIHRLEETRPGIWIPVLMTH